MSPLLIGAYKEHFACLCRAYGINNQRARKPKACRAFSEEKHIWTLPIRSALSYAIALHEIGHCVTNWRAGNGYKIAPLGVRRMNMEALAWQWAREVALEWTPAMQHTFKYSWTDYLKLANTWVYRGYMS